MRMSQEPSLVMVEDGGMYGQNRQYQIPEQVQECVDNFLELADEDPTNVDKLEERWENFRLVYLSYPSDYSLKSLLKNIRTQLKSIRGTKTDRNAKNVLISYGLSTQLLELEVEIHEFNRYGISFIETQPELEMI